MADSPIAVPKLTQAKADAIAQRERLAGLDLRALLADDDETAAIANASTAGGQVANLAQHELLERKLARLAEWIKTELALNVVPLYEGMVDAIESDVVAELEDLGEEVEGLLENAEVLHAETAAQIVAVFEAGRVVCGMLEKLAKHTDQVTRKRCADAIRQYRGAALETQQIVLAITVPDDGDGDEGDDRADDEEDDDGAGDGEPADQEPAPGAVAAAPAEATKEGA